MQVAGYDSVQGIRDSLPSLASFRALLEARREAAQHGERLHDFFVLSRYWLDEFGSLGIMGDGGGVSLRELFPDMPDVLTAAEFWTYANAHSNENISIVRSLAAVASLPEPNIPCALCERSWDQAEAYECVSAYSTQSFPLTEFAGRTFGEFTASLSQRTDALYRIQPELAVSGCRVTDDYVLRESDETFLNIWRFYHPVCHRNLLAAEQERTFRVLFQLAGYEPHRIVLKPVTNRYGSDCYRGPWFEVSTPDGIFTIGWRKRVIHLGWPASNEDLLVLFDDITDTKGPGYIHAWRYGQVVDYVSRIRVTLERSTLSKV